MLTTIIAYEKHFEANEEAGEKTVDFFGDLKQAVDRALKEDLGEGLNTDWNFNTDCNFNTGWSRGDITAQLVDIKPEARAHVICRQAAVICGRPWVDEVFHQVDQEITLNWHVDEGERVAADARILTATGAARHLLTAERTALNFLQLLSGTATATRRYADLLEGSGTTLLDTRKTVPGLRLAQKYAVHKGGGANHRIGLYDAFLIKENHIKAAGGITQAIQLARETGLECRVEVEVESLEQLDEAVAAGPDWIMLDNFSTDDMARACERVKGSGIKLEASGGIETPEALLAVAATGVDYVSMGSLTKNVEAVDLSMLFE